MRLAATERGPSRSFLPALCVHSPTCTHVHTHTHTQGPLLLRDVTLAPLLPGLLSLHGDHNFREPWISAVILVARRHIPVMGRLVPPGGGGGCRPAGRWSLRAAPVVGRGPRRCHTLGAGQD